MWQHAIDNDADMWIHLSREQQERIQRRIDWATSTDCEDICMERCQGPCGVLDDASHEAPS
jgi:hypothetical protein